MFEAMDRAAESMLKLMENEETDDKGKPTVTLKEKMEAFAMCERWLNRRAKSRPNSDSDAGVEVLKQMLQDPKEIVTRLKADPDFIMALELLGWLRPPEKLKGRPTTAQAAHRAEYDRERRARYGENPPAPDATPEAAAGWGQFGLGAQNADDR